MTDTTTIEITTAQKAELDGLKDHSSEAYKSVIGRVIRSYRNGKPHVSDSESVEINEAAVAEALADYLINGENLPQRVADELGSGRR